MVYLINALSRLRMMYAIYMLYAWEVDMGVHQHVFIEQGVNRVYIGCMVGEAEARRAAAVIGELIGGFVEGAPLPHPKNPAVAGQFLREVLADMALKVGAQEIDHQGLPCVLHTIEARRTA